MIVDVRTKEPRTPTVAEVIAAIAAWQAAPRTCPVADDAAADELGRMLARAYVHAEMERRA